MSVPSPSPFDNSFDTFYRAQQVQRQSSAASQTSQQSNGHRTSQSFGPNWQGQGERPMMDEPHSLSRRGSNTSLASHHSRERSTSLVGQTPGSGEWRQESLPFDPESSSTLIATAQQGQQGVQHGIQDVTGMQGVVNQEMLPPIQDYQQNLQSYGGMPQMPQNQYLQYNQDAQNGHSPFSMRTHGLETSPAFHQQGMESYTQNGMQNQQGNTGWGNEFLDQQDSHGDGGLMHELERMYVLKIPRSSPPACADFSVQHFKLVAPFPRAITCPIHSTRESTESVPQQWISFRLSL